MVVANVSHTCTYSMHEHMQAHAPVSGIWGMGFLTRTLRLLRVTPATATVIAGRWFLQVASPTTKLVLLRLSAKRGCDLS